ncbi:MAG: helix-turn-helix transcriptional regulator [Oscillospiraceae bacterium]|nr:helix-turn-helix transcriptional regulator [Oscillospiraceae bacterium]
MNQIIFQPFIYDVIRKNIKKYRKERGITAAVLAELVDLSHEFIRGIESEKVAYNFSVDTFYKISVALGVTLDELIKEE